MSENIIEFRNITKEFPGVKALDDISFAVKRGDVHALVGENGAGKSTIIKTVTGSITPSSGEIIYDGEAYRGFEPSIALDKGIVAIYQEFNLFQYLSVAENIFYGREPKKGLFIDHLKMNKDAKKIIAQLKVNLDPQSIVCEIGVAYQQIVEICKAISRRCELLIMDEPTAPLTNNEKNALFDVIKYLNRQGVTIIYISHRMDEIFDICNKVTVLRDGKHICTKSIDETNRKELISLMVGRDLNEQFTFTSHVKSEIVFSVKNATNNYIKNVSFDLRKGEILGIGGLVGAGRTELARAIFGADKLIEGEVELFGKIVRNKSPKWAIKNSLCLLPEDRKRQGAILSMTVNENISYASMGKVSNKLGIIHRRIEHTRSQGLSESLRIKTPSLKQRLINLSGGNQQKVILAKWLATECEIFIFDEPTRGIDVGSKREIYELMKELTSKGKSIIMISSEMPELLGVSDRIIVMSGGRVAGVLDKEEATQIKILELASSMIS